jgi:hypothetical protein
MSSLSELPELVGFFSYSRSDDQHSGGALSRLPARACLSRPLASAPQERRGLCSSAPHSGAPAGQSFEHAALARGLRSPTKPREVHGSTLKSRGPSSRARLPTARHRLYAVTKNGKQSFWQPIGAAWAHTDGEGFDLCLEYLPLNDAEIVIRKPNSEITETAGVFEYRIKHSDEVHERTAKENELRGA